MLWMLLEVLIDHVLDDGRAIRLQAVRLNLQLLAIRRLTRRVRYLESRIPN